MQCCIEEKKHTNHLENKTCNQYKYCWYGLDSDESIRDDYYFLNDLLPYEIEIIGNIHENPELLTN